MNNILGFRVKTDPTIIDTFRGGASYKVCSPNEKAMKHWDPSPYSERLARHRPDLLSDPAVATAMLLEAIGLGSQPLITAAAILGATADGLTAAQEKTARRLFEAAADNAETRRAFA